MDNNSENTTPSVSEASQGQVITRTSRWKVSIVSELRNQNRIKDREERSKLEEQKPSESKDTGASKDVGDVQDKSAGDTATAMDVDMDVSISKSSGDSK